MTNCYIFAKFIYFFVVITIFRRMFQGIVNNSGACEAHSPAENRSYFSVMTFGGCHLHYTSELLSKFGETRHYWRHNIISDMGGSIPLERVDVGDEVANRTINRYIEKSHLVKISQSEADAFVFECASDFVFSYLKVGDGFMPDIRNDLFSDGWSQISFDDIDLLSKAESISADDPIYWTMWLSAFSDFYERVLKEKIANGKRIFFIRRLLAPHTFSADGRECINSPEIFLRNEILRRVYREIEKFSGLDFIDPPESLLFSSVNAPSGGPWEMHPDEEYYTFVVDRILRELLEDQTVSNQFRWDRLAALATARATAEMRVSILESEIAGHRQQCDELAEERNRAALLIAEAEKKNGELGGWAHTLHIQRDRLFEENQLLLEKLEVANRNCATWKSKFEICEQSKWWHALLGRRF